MVMATNSFHQITKYAIWLSHVTSDPTQCEHELILNKDVHVKCKNKVSKVFGKKESVQKILTKIIVKKTPGNS